MPQFTKHSAYNLLLFIFLIPLCTSATSLKIRGQIKGLTESKRFTDLTVLENAEIKLYVDDKKIATYDITNGAFAIELEEDKIYVIEINKKGYHSKSLIINTGDLPPPEEVKAIELRDLDFILLSKKEFKKDIGSKEPVGEFFYNPNRSRFQIKANKNFRRENNRFDNSLRTFRKSNTIVIKAENSNSKKDKSIKDELYTEFDSIPQDSILNRKRFLNKIDKNLNNNYKNFENLNEIENAFNVIDSTRQNIKDLYLLATTKEDSLIVEKMLLQLESAELNLQMAEKTIFYQENDIKLQKKLNYFYIISFVLLTSYLISLFIMNRRRNKKNKELKLRNKTILDSLKYANRLQSNFLKSKEKIKEIIPQFMLYFKPRGLVSGDAYWVEKVNDKDFIVSIDCTAEGVAGGFMSILVNALLNEIILKNGVEEPQEILTELHNSFFQVLNFDTADQNLDEGLAIGLVVIDNKTKKLKFSGASSSIYICQKSDWVTIRGDEQFVGRFIQKDSTNAESLFTLHELDFSSDDQLYLFSEGFRNQLGGNKGAQPFGKEEFENLLKECATLSVKEQEVLLQLALNEWMGDYPQQEDVLVMGLRLS